MIRVLLFLLTNNFFTYANYFAIFILSYDTLVKRRLVIPKIKNITFFCLAIASLSFMLLSEYNGYEISTSSFALKFVLPICMFYIGYTRGLNGFNSWKMDVIVIMFATFIHGFLNVVTNRNTNVLLIEGRQYQDIYGGAISATLQNLMFVLSSALLFYFLIYEKNLKFKILGIFAALAGAYGSIANASRTLLYVIALVFFMCLFLHLILKYSTFEGIVRGVTVACGMIIVVLFIMWIDLFGIQEWFAQSALGQREATAVASSSVSQNLRWGYASDILKLLPSYPLGNIPYAHYAHNLWVDIAKETGIIPFILYILFCAISAVTVITYLKRSNFDREKVIFVSSIFVASILVFFTEPVMEGSPMTFGIFCFVVGGGILSFKVNRNIISIFQNPQQISV